jgi:hypothetical protein
MWFPNCLLFAGEVMVFKIPVIGFIEKQLRVGIVSKFLAIFRNTADVHRVIMFIPLTLLASHIYYFKSLPRIGVIFYKLQRDELILIGLVAFFFVFALCWSIFSSPFNLQLYLRQSIFAAWTGLLHRLSYGLDTLGSTYPATLLFMGLTLCLPYAFMGLRLDQVWEKIKENHEAKKSAEIKAKNETIVFEKTGS